MQRNLRALGNAYMNMIHTYEMDGLYFMCITDVAYMKIEQCKKNNEEKTAKTTEKYESE